MALCGCNPSKPAAGPISPPLGRFVIVHSPHVERETQLLDTATGDTWALTSASDLNGEPYFWQAVPRINTDAEETAFYEKHGLKDDPFAALVPKAPAAAPTRSAKDFLDQNKPSGVRPSK